MKGVVLSLAPATTLVDITHAIPPQDVKAGAVALAQAAPLFPRGTIHVAVVDPGVGGARADLVVEAADGDLFIGPDNGLLSLAARAPRRAYRIEEASFTRQPVSPTFHGRDVFAPTAGRLAAGARAADVGPPAGAIVELDLPLQRWLGDRVDGAVIHVDTYGNLVTSVTADAVPPGADIEVVVEGTEGTFHPRMGRTFGDVEPGALVAYVGSMGRLEIAVRDGSAAARIGAARGSVVRLRGCGPEGGVA